MRGGREMSGFAATGKFIGTDFRSQRVDLFLEEADRRGQPRDCGCLALLLGDDDAVAAEARGVQPIADEAHRGRAKRATDRDRDGERHGNHERRNGAGWGSARQAGARQGFFKHTHLLNSVLPFDSPACFPIC